MLEVNPVGYYLIVNFVALIPKMADNVGIFYRASSILILVMYLEFKTFPRNQFLTLFYVSFVW